MKQGGMVDLEFLVIGALLSAIVALVFVAAHFGAEEARQWAEFSQTHQCGVVATKQSQSTVGVGTAVGSNGNVSVVPVVGSIPSQKAYLCNDGVTYWRND